MKSKNKSIDLVSYKDGKKFAFEIETGKNTKEQLIENIRKCQNENIDKLYLIATNNDAYNKIRKVLDENDLIVPRLYLARAKI